MAKVKLVKLILPQAGIEKLTAKDKKRYVMFTSMLRDLNLLQKCLVFVGNTTSPDAPSKSAKTTIAFFFLKTLISKIHEMGVFLKKNHILDRISNLNDATRMSERVKEFFADQKIDGICSFIRNKFGFHYEYRDEVDGLIENEAKEFSEFEIWLSTEDSGNEIFASTNAIMLKVIFSEMKNLGFIGDDAKLFDDLFELALRGARIIREFTIAYLTEVLPVTWVQTEELEIMTPTYSDVKLPLIVAGQL